MLYNNTKLTERKEENSGNDNESKPSYGCGGMKGVRACINFELFFDLKLSFNTVLFMDIEKVLVWKAERLLS